MAQDTKKIYKKNKKSKDLQDDEIAIYLKTVADHFEKEDRVTRERQIRHYRRLKLYWNNFSQVYWSEMAHDYRIWNRDISSTDTDQDYYDKPVNVFKAFLETIIAALSINIPTIDCVPDDADNELDNLTAKGGDKIAEQIYKHNDVLYLWLHALYIYCTEGMIACYSYPHTSKEYGTYDKEKYQEKEEDAYVCPSCGARIPDIMAEHNDTDNAETQPQGDEANQETQGDGNSQQQCLECEAQIPEDLSKSKIKVKRLVGVTKEPKSRVCLEVYGGLYVKTATYAKKQDGTAYLRFAYETHYSEAMECYPEYRSVVPQGGWSYTGPYDPYEQYGRLNTQYRGEAPDENVTVSSTWLRPAAFNILPDDQMEKLRHKFPEGACITCVNEVPVEYYEASLDDQWTLSENPMSDFLVHDPMGELLTNIQDIVNDLISLTLQTIEHGIAQTWVDPAVVNLSAQKQIEAMPGTITATKPLSGSRGVKDAFYQSTLAQLHPEVITFFKIIQELGQFVSGALPSIFGGQLPAGSSRTASEYATSKGMALQRLQTPWRMMTIWWKKIFAKAIPMYIDLMEDDERIVEKDERGNFINVFIKRAEMAGKIGGIELEPDDRMPVTDEQKADVIMKLMELNNQEIMQALMDPENLPELAKVINIPSFKLPGEDDREKQYEEINELINSVPIPPDPQSVQMSQQTGQPPPQPQSSIQIDPDVDNHQVEAAICKSWLVSPAGRLCKKENIDGYTNVLLHMKAHLQQVQQQIQAQQLHSDQLELAGVAKRNGNSSRGSEPKNLVRPPKRREERNNDGGKIGGQSGARSPVS